MSDACRALHQQIAEYNRLGVKVRYVFFPRTGPNTESWYKAEQVWCSADRRERPHLRGAITALTARLGTAGAIFVIVSALGLGAGIFTAIISALILTEVVTILRLDRACEIKLTVCACYAIGLGAALTPLGEPLSTIVVARLKGPPHGAGFFYLLGGIGPWVVPGVLLSAAMAARGSGAAASVGAFQWSDPSSKDSAILVTLPPGSYTAQVSGSSGDTGVALVEVYEVP